MTDRFSTRINFPYLLGVEIAMNAIPDAHILMDSSDCIMALPEFIKNHDLNSTLLDAAGFHRIFHTNADIHSAARNRTGEIAASIRLLADSGRVKTLFVSPTPMTIITGYQYDKIIRDMKIEERLPVIELTRKGLLGDWLDGYADTLEAIANRAKFSCDGGPRSAVIVGYFMDRSEEDNLGNIRELKRIAAEGLGLDVVSVWLENKSIDNLMNGVKPAYVISMPHARKAAAALAEKAGATLIEAGIPIGLNGTREWLMSAAEILGETARAENFAKAELSRLAPKLEWAIQKYFMGRLITYSGDPHLASGLRGLVEEAGCAFRRGALFADTEKISGPADDSGESELRTSAFAEALRAHEKIRPADLHIANSIAAKEIRQAIGSQAPVLEFGFPSYNFHALHDTPYIGFRGAMSFYNRMMARL